MTTKDRGSTIQFFEGCIFLAELQFTGDFGNVLLVNPDCTTLRNPRFWSSTQIVRPEYRRSYDFILDQYAVDRVTFKRFA